jgi:hypothetical protein
LLAAERRSVRRRLKLPRGAPDPTPAMAPNTSLRSDPWLSATGQRWKLAVFAVLIAISGGLFAGLILAVNDVPLIAPLSVVQLGLGQVAFGAFAFAWLLLSIRCTTCKRSFAWAFISRGDHGSWWHRMSNARSCPWCEANSHSAAV